MKTTFSTPQGLRFLPLFFCGLFACATAVPSLGLGDVDSTRVCFPLPPVISQICPSTAWRRAPSPTPEALVVLQSVNANFPTFNILLQGGTYQLLGLSLETQARDILASYHSIGAIDPQIIKITRRTYPFGSAVVAELTYTAYSQALRSMVAIIPLPESHLIVTLIDFPSGFDNSRPEIEALLNSLRLTNPQVLSEEKETSSLLIFLIIISLTVTAFLVIAFTKDWQRLPKR